MSHGTGHTGEQKAGHLESPKPVQPTLISGKPARGTCHQTVLVVQPTDQQKATSPHGTGHTGEQKAGHLETASHQTVLVVQPTLISRKPHGTGKRNMSHGTGLTGEQKAGHLDGTGPPATNRAGCTTYTDQQKASKRNVSHGTGHTGEQKAGHLETASHKPCWLYNLH